MSVNVEKNKFDNDFVVNQKKFVVEVYDSVVYFPIKDSLVVNHKNSRVNLKDLIGKIQLHLFKEATLHFLAPTATVCATLAAIVLNNASYGKRTLSVVFRAQHNSLAFLIREIDV